MADLSAHDVRGLATLIETNEAELILRENRVLQLAAASADVHATDPDVAQTLLGERSVRLGGEGTPLVSEFAGTDLGPLLGKSPGAARSLLGDVLDIRHRLPALWRLVLAGRVRGWQARKVAQATRPLPIQAAFEVDQALAGYAGQLGWTRFTTLLEAAILEADPELAAQREAGTRRGRGVWTTQAKDGDKTIVARTDAGTAVWFLATLNRVADLLAADGDTDTADLRRSKSIGWMAQPDRLLQLFADHQNDTDVHDCPADDHDEEDHDGDDHDDAEDPMGPSTGSGDVWSEPADPVLVEEDTHMSLEVQRPKGCNHRAARPRVVLHFHLSDAAVARGAGVVRPEHDPAPISLDQLRRFLTDTGCHVTVRPVVDPADTATCGDPPPDASSWSPTKAPSRSRSAMPSGTSHDARQRLETDAS